MHLTERRIYAGCTLEIQKYLEEKVRARNPERSAPNPRFKSKEEREEFMLARSRRKFERLVNENFTPSGYYCTFTCSKEYECHTPEDIKYLRDLFWRRLRRYCPDVKIVMVCGRNGSSKDKKTGKKLRNGDAFHLHAAIEGASQEDIARAWTFGHMRIDPLREHCYYEGVDHGPDYTALADYMLDHWKPEQGPRRWKATRNMSKPDIEVTFAPADDTVKKNGGDSSIPETPKGYIFVSAEHTKYGFSSFKFVIDPKPRKDKHGSGRDSGKAANDSRNRRKKAGARKRE